MKKKEPAGGGFSLPPPVLTSNFRKPVFGHGSAVLANERGLPRTQDVAIRKVDFANELGAFPGVTLWNNHPTPDRHARRLLGRPCHRCAIKTSILQAHISGLSWNNRRNSDEHMRRAASLHQIDRG